MKEIPGYEELYACDVDGKVYSLPKVIQRKNGWDGIYEYHYQLKELIPTLRDDGYQQVSLRKNHKTRTFLVHELIALTFLNKKSNEQIIHKDGNKTNNAVENFEIIE